MELIDRADLLSTSVVNRSDTMTQKPAILEQAFDRTLVKPLLQQAMISKNSGYQLEDCLPSKAFPLAGNIWRMQYHLVIKNHNNEQVSSTIANAMIFPSLAQGNHYLKTRLRPLARQVRDRPELNPFIRLVSLVKPLQMVVSVFPIDGALPTLVGATDPKLMLEIFNQTLPISRSKNLVITGFDMELAHYGRHERCVIRYTVNAEHEVQHTHSHLPIYGKINSENTGRITDELIQSLQEKLRSQALPFSFQIPKSYGYIEDLKLLLMEAIPGQPVVKHLIHDGPGYEMDGLTIKQAIQISGRIAAAFHKTGITIGDPFTLTAFAEQVRKELVTTKQEQPDLAARIYAYLDKIVGAAQGCAVLPFVLNHGDYTYTQLIFHGKSVGLVDFDSICQAEPALDLGQFIAYQRLAFLKEQDPANPFSPQEVDTFCEYFLEAYFEMFPDRKAAEGLVRTRTLFYELLSLVRLMVHSAEKQKSSRFLLVTQVVEERMQCLNHLELPKTK